MPNLNAKGAGDNFYPQYNVVTTEPVGAITVTKGRLYTKDASGNLIAATATGFARGLYQATRTIATAGAAGANSVQCFGPRSRIGIPAKVADMHPGDRVSYDVATHDVNLAPLSTVNANNLNTVIGRIYKIFTKTDITVEKKVTAVGDIVIVEFGDGL